MKILEKADKIKYKEVNFHGITLSVQTTENFIAADKDGSVWSFITEPHADNVRGEWGNLEYSVFVARVGLGDVEWSETLMEI